ncbi:MAG: helix-turn-helix transcriptional regulator [Lachnospiraceae bacterium]|nr:helix-turn-helix transcriptional regulator [Lachnospiraceae bacterium]MBP5745275.1 helix-turn-helix transcriptional regulator [Lachnospiraceae bacterium]
MDQEKIGKFIAACRKEKGLTQAALAEKLGITDRAVSKWETGKSLPDASIMMELCELIGTNVNELLTGERIPMDEYAKKAEQSLIEMQAKAEKADRNLLRMEIAMGIIIIPLSIVLAKISEIFSNQGDALIGNALLVLSYVAIVLFGFIGLKIEHDAGYYECPNCGERYVPSMLSVILAIHLGTARRLKCPYCEKKGFHKKVISKKKE